MADTLEYVEKNMDEGDFYLTLTWNAIKATVTMLAILFVAFILIPFSVSNVPGTFWLSLAVTYSVMVYVFRKRIYTDKAKSSGWELVKNCFNWFLIAIGYNVVMYVGGEIVFIGLVILGVAMMIIFLSGDFSLTSWFTYLDLKKWVREQKKIEKAKEG